MIIDVDKYGPFHIREEFLESYRDRPVDWGFGALSRVTFLRTYSRNGEEWWQTCRRVIEGMYTVQRIYCIEQGLPWNQREAEARAEYAYDRMFSFKWTPPGRGLWIMGTRFMYERGGEALNNCGFVSTKDIDIDFSEPFVWMFKMSMLGVGVGFDTLGRGKATIDQPVRSGDVRAIEDSREGWTAALERVLLSYVGKASLPAEWDYSKVRPKGSRLKSFGGYASGPEPLERMLEDLRILFEGYVGSKIDSTLIVDIMNIIGRCVVAGGIRRSAQIALGNPEDESFINLKEDIRKAKEYRWVSNNSVFAERGMDYSPIVDKTVSSGEPGYFWLNNARFYGRMCEPRNELDAAAMGCNPCVEQTLWDRELCCLVETYPARHDSLGDYLKTLKLAYEYAKTVTLIPTLNRRTNAVMERNRRLGCSMTGVVQAINRIGYREMLNWCDLAYNELRQWDREFSDSLFIPRSIKLSSIKPSGTVSLLAGATPGVHWGYAPFYIRRVRVQESHPLVEKCRKAGYNTEGDAYSGNSIVIEFPVHAENLKRSRKQVPLWEKLDLAAQMQRYWSDNQVSSTATFDPEKEGGQLGVLLEAFEDRLKAISFLPDEKHGYEQPPYQEISEDQYNDMRSRLSPLEGVLPHEHQLEARFCEGEECEISPQNHG
ncbi:MAG: hypothetical protein ACOC6C_05195 [Verrucomicrobiota bacterium]